MAEDIIISAFATPSQGNLNAAGLRSWKPRDVQPVDGLTDGARVIDVPKTGAPGQPPEAYGTLPFGRTADDMRRKGGGSILQGLLRTYAPGVTPRRICLIGFSAGNKFVHDVLGVAQDAELIDTVFSLDGLVYAMNYAGDPIPSSFQPYESFARRASGLENMLAGKADPYLSPLMVHAHTRIELTDSTGQISKTASSTWKAGDLVFSLINKPYQEALAAVSEEVIASQGRRQAEVRDRLSRALLGLPYPATIKCGGTDKTYNPGLESGEGGVLPKTSVLGNYWDLDFGGTQGPDHCFIAYYAQRALWESYLIPRWNSRSSSIGGLGALPWRGRGLGATERVTFQSPSASQPGGGILARGAIDTGASMAQLLMMSGVGAAIGYLAYKIAKG